MGESVFLACRKKKTRAAPAPISNVFVNPTSRHAMSTELIQLQDGLLVEVQSNPEDTPRQIAASAAELAEGAMDQARELLLKAVQPLASVWGELNRDLTIDEVEIQLGLGFEAKGKLFIVQGTGSANLRFTLKVRPKTRD
jgi:hypothetical protein